MLRWFGREESVPVETCVHFGGWRYGCSAVNPYENYVISLAAAAPVAAAREQFVEFLRYYRPRHLGEALGIDLEREYRLWHFPWAKSVPAAAWLPEPRACPDILTHYSLNGVLRSRIEEEFGWLESTFYSIRERGYQPARFSGPLHARRFVAADGSTRNLMLDGNHRLSALVALGHRSVDVRYLEAATVREVELPTWKGVVDGIFTEDDARRVFKAYVEGNQTWHIAAVPAHILEDREVAV